MKFSNGTYDKLKWVCLVLLPAIEVLWLTLGKIWGFPYLVEIGSTIAAVDVFLGSLLGVSTRNYRADKTQDTFNEDGKEIYGVGAYEEETDSTEE